MKNTSVIMGEIMAARNNLLNTSIAEKQKIEM
jgi:hypothetical protein